MSGFEELLFGAVAAAGVGATETGAALAPVAATSGLIGTGGAFSAATAASTALTAAGVVGTGLTVASQLQGGNAAQAVGDYNAQTLMNEAAQRREATKQDTYQISKKARAIAGEQAAILGASGIEISGTPLEVMAHTASEYEKDIVMRGYSGEVGAITDVNKALLSEWEGKQRKKASQWQAGTTLLTGLGKLGLAKWPTILSEW